MSTAEDVKSAWKVIKEADDKVKREVFKDELKHLRAMHIGLVSAERGAFLDKPWLAGCLAMGVVEKASEVYGYDFKDSLLDALPYIQESRQGRPEKFSIEEQSLNCVFIDQMIEYGCSKTQAIKLLIRLRGDANTTSEGQLRFFRDKYNLYVSNKTVREAYRKNVGALVKVYALDFKVENLVSSEKASLKAKECFYLLWDRVSQEFVDNPFCAVIRPSLELNKIKDIKDRRSWLDENKALLQAALRA